MKKVIATLIILPLLGWSIWHYFSQPLYVEEEIVQENSNLSSKRVADERPLTVSMKNHVHQNRRSFEEKWERMEEKYMMRLETLARLLKGNNLQDLSIGDEMPDDLPEDVAQAWQAYLSMLSKLEKLKVEQDQIEEDFIQMARKGVSLALIEG
ncbi:MAG: hypothetical protein HYV97_08425 [Bdellovibrio sp.]|nr:hypothetical protein [Bdellovibrio sp.]